jgi:hypothetical protein
MLGRGSSLISSRHRKSIQSLLALSTVLGCATGTALRGSSDSDYGQIPLAFIANRGQTHRSVRFTAKAPGLTAYFTPGEVVVDVRGSTIRMQFPGANVSPSLDGLDPQSGRANFLIGDDPGQWRTDVPLYSRVVYRDLFPGIDMVYSSHRRLLKSEFVVAPGADPARIRIAYSGVEDLRVDEGGGLVFTTASGELREEAPEIYQESAAGRDIVKGAFQVSGGVVTFFVEPYDRSRPLRIDPVLSYSTYLGGAGTERANAIAVDSSGAAYVTGYTDSTDYPVTSGVIRTTAGGSVDAFVTKLNASGNAIVYSTYLGGAGDDRAFSIAVDSSGDAFVTGYTTSTNFPTAGALQSASGGGRDAFVVKLNPAGTALLYGAYLGGSGTDSGSGIAIDSGGAAYITGSTTSTNFPVTGPFQAALAGAQDGFVTKVNAAGSVRVYSTYLGGSLDDRGSAIAVDSSGAAYIAGNTSSTNFPTLTPLQAASGGSQDAFVTKLSASGATLAYSTYLGGSGTETIELGRSIAVDAANSAYVVGSTSSTNFPVAGPLQAVNNGGGNDAFVVKLTAAGTALAYGTYLGGASVDFGESIAVDSTGAAYIAGYTSSADFPTVSAGQPAIGGNYDAFVAKLNVAGNALSESGFLGGAGADAAYGIAIDSSLRAYLTGQTGSTNFPVLGPAQSSGGTTLAAFVARFTFGPTGPPAPVSVTPASGSGSSQIFTLLYQDSRGFADISWVEMSWNATQATANACYLHYDRATNVLQLSNDAGTGWVGSATLGSAGTLQNSQCTVDSGTSSASGTGNNLTLNLSLTFKQAFGGAKNVYMQVMDISNTVAPWQALGSWNVVAAGPGVVSLTPASGSGLAQMFGFVFSDPYGFADLSVVQAHFGTQLVSGGVCYAQYTRATNTIQLVNDSGGGFAGSATLGSAGTISNGQCTLDTGASTASGSGNNLTVNLSLTFKGPFAGAKTISMSATNNASVFSGWQSMGTWTVPAGGSLPPANVGVTPSSGSGSSQTFSFTFTDPAGFADINWTQMHFQTTLTGQNACYVQYTRASNALQLWNDAGSNYVGSAAPGVAGTLNNSQCTVDAGASSVTTSGTNLTVNLALVFKPAFAGGKNVSMSVTNNANAFSGWQALGAWTATNAITLPPGNVSVTPSSGAGSSQTFSFVYSDPYGYTDINWVQMHVQTTLVADHACYVQYTRANNNVQLLNDAGTGYVGTGGTLGVAGTLANGQCTVDLGASTVSGAGNNLTVNLALSFPLAFSGAKNVSMGAINNGNIFSGWQTKGTWTVTGPGNLPPVNVSVTPSSGVGLTQTFAFVYSDPYGFADVSWTQMHFGAQLQANSVCYLQYTRAANTIQLFNDAGSAYVGSGGTVGAAGTLGNSQCSVNLAASSTSGSGNNLTVNLSMTFAPGFAGAKTTSMGVINNAGVFSGWQAKGTWTVQ